MRQFCGMERVQHRSAVRVATVLKRVIAMSALDIAAIVVQNHTVAVSCLMIKI